MLDEVVKENTTSEAKFINTIQGRKEKEKIIKGERGKTSVCV